MNPAADHLAFLRRIVDEQAEDEGLWFIAQTAPEAYLQQELRRLHTYIECATGKVGGADLYGPMHSAFAPDDPEDGAPDEIGIRDVEEAQRWANARREGLREMTARADYSRDRLP